MIEVIIGLSPRTMAANPMDHATHKHLGAALQFKRDSVLPEFRNLEVKLNKVQA